MRIIDKVHDVGRGGAAQQESRRIRRIDEAMIGVERNRKKRTLLPFECLLLGLAVIPHFGRAAAFNHEDLLFIHMLFSIQCAARRNLNHIHAPQAFRTEELDVCAATAQTLPRLHRQIMHALHADGAMHRNAFCFHEAIIRHGGARKIPEASIFASLWLVPMRAFFCVMGHVFLLFDFLSAALTCRPCRRRAAHAHDQDRLAVWLQFCRSVQAQPCHQWA